MPQPFDLGNGLWIFDRRARSYLGLSRDGTYWHHVRPARMDDPVVGDGLVKAGDLTCDCVAGKFGRACHRVKEARAFEAAAAAPEPAASADDWFAAALDGAVSA